MTKEETEEKKLICPHCEEDVEPCDFNAYYDACINCVNKSGRIGSRQIKKYYRKPLIKLRKMTLIL